MAMATGVPELAERIKAHRAENTVEATLERISTRQVSAEEPVTARIRRRAETNVVSEGDEKPATLVDNPDVVSDKTSAGIAR